ncbi:MAG: hypothetical protein ACHQU1_00620 [Gemmatimonadales bacterium]
MRRAFLLALLVATPLAAQERAVPAGVPTSLGATFETNVDPGDRDLVRMPIQWSLGSGLPRTTRIEVEPSLGWHLTAGTEDASGLSYTRVRIYHVFGSDRLGVGPDFEAILKTESTASLAYGYDRFMPGFQAAILPGGGWRATLRARYEWTAGEDPGVTPFRRVAIRPTLYTPPVWRLSFWARGDLMRYTDSRPNEYNVEAFAALKPDAGRRLTLFVEQRVYVGAAARAKHLWRLRSGVVWSLGNFVLHHREGG